jgi:hypothetical protein
MPKMISPIFKFQGTIADLTFVDSKRYGKHVRTKQGTYTPVTINDTLKESKALLQKCNQQAKVIFHPLRDEHRDGGLWSRLLSQFFKRAKAGLKPHVNMFADMEVHAEYKLETLLDKDYTVNVTTEKKKMKVAVKLLRHPIWENNKNITGYYLNVVVIYPNFSKYSFKKEEARIDIPSIKATPAPEPMEFELPMPSAQAPYLVLLGLSGYGQGKVGEQPSCRGLLVVKTT